MFDIANEKYLIQREIIAAISSVPISMLTHALGLLKGTYSSKRRGRELHTLQCYQKTFPSSAAIVWIHD